MSKVTIIIGGISMEADLYETETAAAVMRILPVTVVRE